MKSKRRWWKKALLMTAMLILLVIIIAIVLFWRVIRTAASVEKLFFSFFQFFIFFPSETADQPALSLYVPCLLITPVLLQHCRVSAFLC